jgi:hypothetical protein
MLFMGSSFKLRVGSDDTPTSSEHSSGKLQTAIGTAFKRIRGGCREVLLETRVLEGCFFGVVMQGRAVLVARQVHNLKVAGSNPVSAPTGKDFCYFPFA